MAIDDLNFSGYAPAMSPGQSGTGGFTAPTSDDPLTSISQTGNAGSGVSGASIAKALSDLSASLKQTGGGDSSVPQHGPAPVGSAQSGTGQGSASGINALVQMLMQNQNKYFPGGPNTQPVAQGRQAGLLGF